jgi:hypothetical protein
MRTFRTYALLTVLFFGITVGVGAYQFPQVQTGFGLWWKQLVAKL